MPGSLPLAVATSGVLDPSSGALTIAVGAATPSVPAFVSEFLL